MKNIRIAVAVLLVSGLAVPARADFTYTETSQVTGGALVKMVKFASVFSRGDAKKQQQQALQPTATTHSIKGNRLRIDNDDGTAQIIDLDGRRIISIDTNKKTYAVATFDEIRAAMQQAEQNAQQQMQQQEQQDPKLKDTQLNITPAVRVTPGSGNRVILNQPTNESKVQMDLAMQATAKGQSAPPPQGQPNSATVTYSMNMDTFVAPDVKGYAEFSQFYRRMAQEVSWMTLPSNIHVDPRVSQGMSSLQQNSDALKGFPLLSYVSMTLAATGQPSGSQTAAQDQSASNPPPSSSDSSNNKSPNSSSDSSVPTSASAAVVKGLGGLFGRKKQADNSSQSSNGSNTNQGPPPNPNSDPNSLIEITTQVTSFSESSLDGSLFDIPAGYTQLQVDPTAVLAGRSAQQQPQPQPEK